MGAPKHPPEVRARAMGALWASVEEVGGEPVPNFNATGIREGLHHTVLMRWWKERDRSLDAEARTIAARAREAVAEEGGRDWYETHLTELQSRVGDLICDKERFKKATIDAAARAAKDLATTLEKVAALLDPDDDAPDEGGAPANPTPLGPRVSSALGRLMDGGRPDPTAQGADPDG